MDEKFEIRDKRSMDAQGNPKDGAASAQQQAGRPAPAKEPPGQESPRQADAAAPEASGFLAFAINLAGMAYMALGLGEAPTEPNLPEAKYIIDSLDMLGNKTKGNLTPDEEKGLRGIIYELKMNFSKVASGGSRK